MTKRQGVHGLTNRIAAWDSRWGPLMRSVWLFVITLLVLFALGKIQEAVHGNKQAIQGTTRALLEVQEGRHVAVGVTCAALSAVTEAGRTVIIKGALMPENALTRFLEQHGYPPQAVRVKQAKVAARAYAQSISAAVDKQVGGKGDHLVLPNGAINCIELQRLSKAKGGQ